MRRFLVGFAILAIAAPSPQLVWACDTQIAEQIVQSLEAEKSKGNLRDFNIELHVEEGAVYLSGFVANQQQEKLAVQAARKASGVQQIFNSIEVVEAKTDPAPPNPIRPVSASSATAIKAAEAGCEPQKKEPKSILTQLNKTDSSRLMTTRKSVERAAPLAKRDPVVVPASSHREESLEDAKRIATEIIDQFRAAKQQGKLRKFGIDVEVDHGVVWLKGTVSNAAHQQLVLEIARRVSGVKQVVNDLTISEPATLSRQPSQHDDAIAQEVVQQLQDYKQSGRLRGFGIDVQVESGSVWLSGYVGDARQQKLVLETARRVAGVEEVVNDLVISGGSQPEPAVAEAAEGYLPVQYTQGGPQTPLAFAPAQAVNHQSTLPGTTPVPMMSASGGGVAAARYDHPRMPGYAWPSYAAYPNYGAVTYPQQYSASAWPYIGPFYPYPQVPLGWRKVTLEWDDGWWQLDFKDRHHR